MGKNQPLTYKQKAFALEYRKDKNATQAAVRAGYESRSADVTGSRLLKDPRIIAIIEASTERALGKIARDGDTVLEECARLGFSDITSIYNDETCSKCGAAAGTLKHPKDMPVEVRRAIKSIEFEELFEGASGEKFVSGRIVKIAFHSKEKGLEMLGKNLKLFTDKVEMSGTLTLEQLVLASIKPKAEE